MNDAIAPESATSDAPNTESVFALRSQYIKDLSFENPRAPQVFMSLNDAPQIDVQVNLTAQRLNETLYELTISINARAVHDKITVFLTDLSYGGIFEARNIPDETVEQALMVQGAFLLFPFARRVISDVTRDGGFPALNLEAIDFFALFMQNRGGINQDAQGAA